MNDQDIQILELKGEILLLKQQIEWWAKNQDMWRCKYLKKHPELDNWDYVEDEESSL